MTTEELIEHLSKKDFIYSCTCGQVQEWDLDIAKFREELTKCKCASSFRSASVGFPHIVYMFDVFDMADDEDWFGDAMTLIVKINVVNGEMKIC